MKYKANQSQCLPLLDSHRATAKKAVEDLLRALQFDQQGDPNLVDTPNRVSKMYIDELFSGCYTECPKITAFPNDKGYRSAVFLGPIQVKSVCSHHLLPIIGSAYVTYLPGNQLVGLSKLARVVQWYMRRPQIQEDLTIQILDHINSILPDNRGIAVYIKATHYCVIARGAEETTSAVMTTSAFSGLFDTESTPHRSTFFEMIRNAHVT